MFNKTNNQSHNLYVLTNRLKANLLEAVKMLKNPNKVSKSLINVQNLSHRQVISGIFVLNIINVRYGIEWQTTGTNLLPSDKKPITQVEYFASETVYKSVFKLIGKHRYNVTLQINYMHNFRT